MLSLFKVTPEMGAHYFSKEDYYSQEDGPAKPEFFGNGCDLLGIKKDFNQITFQKMLEGKSPTNEQLRIIKTKKFKDKGVESYLSISQKFLESMEGITKDDLDECLLQVLKYSNVDIKYPKNKEKIFKAIDEHPVSMHYSKRKKSILIKNLLHQICDHGGINGAEIKTLPENYLAFEHEVFGKMAHKLIDRHLYLSKKEERYMSAYHIYYNALDKYYPEIALSLKDYKTCVESQKKLLSLIKDAPVIGLWSDQNIYKDLKTPNIDRGLADNEVKINNYVKESTAKAKLDGDFNIEKLASIFQDAKEMFPESQDDAVSKVRLSFDDFCKSYSIDKKSVDVKNVEKITLKSHLNSFQAKRLQDLLIEKTKLKDPKQRSLIEKFVTNISKTSDRAGLDLTFSAPKSVSLIALVGGDKELLNAHKEAVKFTLKYIEDNYIGTREGSKEQRTFKKTKNLIASLFYHGTSREKDPQLHTHCVLFNTTFDDKKGWKAIHNDNIFTDRNLLGAIYRKKCADLIIELGYQIAPGKEGLFEIEGFSKDQLESFSKRSQQIQKVLEDNKMSNTSESKALAVLMGRRTKKNISSQELMNQWREEAFSVGLKMPEINKERLIKRINWNFATSHLEEKESVWSSEQLLMETLHANIGRGKIETILKNYEEKSEVKILNSRGVKVGLTNARTIEVEQKIISAMKEGRSTLMAIAPSVNFISLSERRGFNKGQSEALKMILTSTDLMCAWVGVAGSGKSYALKDVKEIAQNHKYKVIGLGPDGNTAKELAKSTSMKTSTLDKFLLQNIGKTIKNQLWIVDEAGKIPSKKMLQLIDKAKGCGARILLTGDTRQIGAVNAGSPFSLLVKNNILRAQLDEHRRQNNPYLKNVVEMASKNELREKSVMALKENTKEFKTRKARLKNVVKSYMSLSATEKDETLILTDLNQDRLDLTNELRKSLKDSGVINKEEIEVTTLKSKDISIAQKRFFWSYTEGDIIVPFKNIEGSSLKKDTQYEVANINQKSGELTLHHEKLKIQICPKKINDFSIYEKKKMPLSVGDKLQFTKNEKDNTNRESVSVKKIDKDLIYFNEKKHPINALEKHYLDHGLVQTTYGSQGQTSNNVILLAESSVSAETWYVGISRAKEFVQVITDNQEKLSKRVTKTNRKVNALDYEIAKAPTPLRSNNKNIEHEVSL